ncbi:protein GON7 [Scheffersomyces xylosifermentans]|uniref:protein GON7 n=1 Tax=Scheffersomyces xylosifermentans TaxID=1304137 RepID=UPI00315DF54B
MTLIPTAEYTAPDVPEGRKFYPGDGEHTTYGHTTQISDVVIKAGGEDRDRPSEAKDTPLGHLRAKLTTIQDQVNVFLTERMKQENLKLSGKEEEDIERRILDDGVDEDDVE